MPSTSQPAPETDEKKSRGLGSYVGRFVVWVFVAMIVYVLSSGPFMWLFPHGVISDRFTENIYKPLKWVSSDDVIGPLLRIYWGLWAPSPGKNQEQEQKKQK